MFGILNTSGVASLMVSIQSDGMLESLISGGDKGSSSRLTAQTNSGSMTAMLGATILEAGRVDDAAMGEWNGGRTSRLVFRLSSLAPSLLCQA